ncbi:hypothetical protein [Rhodococcus opacus]|nr:hypothetical protein [Rhodococcus opacus]
MTEIAHATGNPTTVDAKSAGADYPKLTTTDDWSAHPDVSLQQMSEFANRARAGVGVVLFLSGTIMSGVVSSAEEFYEWANERQREFRPGTSDETMKAAELYSDLFFGKMAADHKGRRESDVETNYELTRHIHLKEAKVIIPGGTPMPVGFTRVLLAHVSAWTLGNIS